MKRITLLKTLTIALFLVMGVGNAWGQYSGSGTFTKITSIGDLTDGYYVITNESDLFAMNNTNAGSFFQHTSISPSSNQLTDPAGTIVWKIETNGGGRTIFNEASSKYVSYTGSSNAAYAVDNVTSDNQRWTFTYASSKFTVMNVEITSRQLSYNSGFPRFAAYGNAGQQELQLYKMEEATNDPLINVNPSTLTGFTYLVGNGPSAEQSFTVEGSNLTDDITITPPTNYEISTGTGGSFAATNPITLSQSGGSVSSTTIYVRLKAGLSAGTYNGEEITCTSTDATDKSVTCDGNVISTETLPFTESFDNSSFPLGWTNDDFTIENNSYAGGAPYEATLAFSNAVEGTSQMTSPPINSAGETSLQLSWKHSLSFYESGGSEFTIKIQSSTDGIDFSNEVWSETVTADQAGSEKATILDASDGVGSATLYLRWILTADDGSFSFWNIDDIFLGYAEPTNHVTDFAATANSSSQITTSWTDAVAGDQAPSGYLVMANKTGTFTDPVDGTAQSDDLDWTDGEAVKNIAHGAKGSYAWTSLDAATQYFFKIFPYNGSGDLINYKTDGTVPTADVTTETNFDNDTEVYAPTTQIAAKSIASTVDTQGEAEDVFTITIEDQGSGDGEPTKVTNIRLKAHSTNTADWTNTIQDVFVDDGTDFIYPTATITDTYIDLAFGAADLNVADNSSVDLTVWMYFNTSGIVDGDIISLMVDADDHGFTADATGSGFVSPFTLGDFNSNDMTIDVTFDEIRFTQQPTNVNLGVAISPAVIVALTDANGNIDTDANGTDYTVGLTTTGTFDAAATTSVDAVNGVVTFDNLIFDAEGTGITLTTTDPDSWGWLNISSDGFDVTDLPKLIISEVADPGDDFNGRFVELYNAGDIEIDFSSTTIYFDRQANGGTHASTQLTGSISPKETYIIGNSSNINSTYGIPADLDFGSVTGNGDDGYFLFYNGDETTGILLDAYGVIDEDGSGTDWEYEDARAVRNSNINSPNATWTASEWTITAADVADMTPGEHNGYVYFNGTTDWNTAANWSNNKVPTSTNNVIIPASKANVEIASDATADCNNLTLNGSLTIKSDDTGTGSLLVNGTVDGSGSTTIERYINGGGYHFVSVPITGTLTAGLFMNSYLYQFDANGQAWDGVGDDPATVITNDQGYMIWYTGASTTYDFSGALINGDFTVATPAAASVYNDPNYEGGYNLVPNPYPSAIDWNAEGGFTESNLFETIWIFNRDAGNYGAYVRDAGSGTNEVSNIIPVGQSFFVQANTAGSGSLTIKNAARIHSSNSLLKEAVQIAEMLRLRAAANNLSDEVIIQFDAEANLAFEGNRDAQKLFSDGDAPQLYSLTPEGTELSINTLPYESETIIVPLGIELSSESEVAFSFTNLESFNPAVDIFLEDLLTNEMLDLRENSSYTFNHEASNDPDRFKLHFMGVTSIDEQLATVDHFRVWTHENQLYVLPTDELTEGSLQIELFDLSGRLIQSVNQQIQKPLILSLPAYEGIVLVRIQNEKLVQTNKIFIR